jgi:hypothetical protein
MFTVSVTSSNRGAKNRLQNSSIANAWQLPKNTILLLLKPTSPSGGLAAEDDYQ